MKVADVLFESSLSRIYQFYTNRQDVSFGLFTAWRQAAIDDAQDKAAAIQLQQQNFQTLKNKLRAQNLGFVELQGRGKEIDAQGNPYVSTEPSLFVPRIPLSTERYLANLFNQDGFIYAGPETDGDVTLFNKDGTSVNLGKFRAGALSQYYSSLKGRDFTFSDD